MSTHQLAGTSDVSCASLSQLAVETTFPAASDIEHHVAQSGSIGLRLCRKLAIGYLQRMTHGQLLLHEGADRVECGQQQADELSVHLQVRSPHFYRRSIVGGSIGAAESYIDGEWNCEQLTDFIRLMLRNEHVLHRVESVWSVAARFALRAQHWLNRNSRMGSRRNIREHYDLGNDFFSLFLDETMMYSSGLFASQQSTMRQASENKLDQVCRSLQLGPSDQVMEIGTGWGGFAIHAAERYGCHVTTTTISDEQYKMARQRVQDAGLSDRIVVLKQDYRDLRGRFDKLVSIEMIEAVGRRYLNGYLSRCAELLKPDGAMLLQAITMPEQRYTRYAKSVDFIQKYIFPGGFLPSVTELHRCAHSVSSLRLLNLFDFGMHYAETLRVWRQRFHENLNDVRALGFSEQFLRMWHYYLCYCEAAFRERATGVIQAVWAMPESQLGLIPAFPHPSDR